MAKWKDMIVDAAQPAVKEIVSIQRDFLEGRGEIKYKDNEDGVAKSPATIGDERSQAIYVQRFNAALGGNNIYYKNEEDVGDEEARANENRKQTAQYRIAIDPIDGTGNYSGDKTPGKERSPVNRSLDELTADELTRKAVRPGWGSMVAIQERQEDGDWKTVASGIYESHSDDTPDMLQGKLYVAEAGSKGVKVLNLQTGQLEREIHKDSLQHASLIVEGGFPKVPGAKEGQAAVQEYADTEGHRIDFSCVAQSALAVITGKAKGFFQGHPNLHDVLAIAHLAENAGLAVIVLDKLGDKQIVQNEKDGKIDIKYPVFMASDPAVTVNMAEKYLDAAGLDKSRVTVRNGNWESQRFEDRKAALLALPKERVAGFNVQEQGSRSVNGVG